MQNEGRTTKQKLDCKPKRRGNPGYVKKWWATKLLLGIGCGLMGYNSEV
jgi:hypothetical protein